MEKNSEDHSNLSFQVKPELLNDFFIRHLNRLFWAKCHLSERLPEIAEQAYFIELKQAISKTLKDIRKEITRIEQIYALLGVEPSLSHFEELLECVETGFNEVFQQIDEPGIRDLSILSYLSLIESVEVASCKMLHMIAAKMPDQKIFQLLQENCPEFPSDGVLFLQIAARYNS